MGHFLPSYQYSSIKVISALLCSVSMSALCLGDSEPDPFDIELTDLAQLKVSIASGEPERIIDTPAVVTSYQTENMQKMGLNTLEDLLNFVPGVVVQDTSIGTKAVMIRGMVEAFNQKVLFLLDGSPYWQPSHGGVPLLAMPFTYIQKVEVIRGPGAVIYGSNASGGVINVITKQSDESNLDIKIDSLVSRDVAFYHKKNYQTFNIRMGGHVFKQKGYRAEFKNRPIPPIYPTDTPLNTTMTKAQASQSIWLAMNSENWQLNLHHFKSQNDGLAAAASTINQSTLEYSGTLIQTEFNQQSPLGFVKLKGDINNFYLRIPTKNLLGFGQDGTQEFEGEGERNNRYRVEGSLQSRFTNNIDWLNGFELELRETGDYVNADINGEPVSTSMAANQTKEVSLYSQLDMSWQASRWVIGARMVENNQAGDDWLPRVSYIYSVDNHRSMKLLYSEGLSAPTFVQQFIEIAPNVVKGDDDIKSEKIRTWELVYTVQKDEHFFVVSIYQLSAHDFIFRTVNDEGIVAFANTSNFTREGLDLDYRYRNDFVEVFGNVSWAFQGNDEIIDDATALFVPKLRANVGVSYAVSSTLNLGGSLIHTSERDTAKAMNVVNITAIYKKENWNTRLYLENLLQEKIAHPDVQNFTSNQLVPTKSSDVVVGAKFQYQF